MKNKTLLQAQIRYLIYILFCIIFWSLFIGGLCIMWTDDNQHLFINYIFSAFGLVGML